MVVRDLTNDIICNIQVLWEKHLTQKELRYGLKIILGKLDLKMDIEMAVLSIHRENESAYGMKNEAVDILEPNEKSLQDRISKWQMIKKWNAKPTTNQWLRYEQIDPKCQSYTANWLPYNVVKEFDTNNQLIRTIELTIWSQQDIDEHIGENTFNRSDIDVKIYQGNKNKIVYL